MADIFFTKEARKVLAKKHVAVIGGSNMRGLYKDIVWLLNDNSIIPREVLGAKSEMRFPEFGGKFWQKSSERISARMRRIFHDENQDLLLKHEGLHPGRTYIEPRFYYHEKHDITINYKFVTKVWSKELDEWLEKYENNQEAKLDLIIMNSVLWDVNRWGPFGIKEYKENLPKLLKRVKSVLSDTGLFIWLTAQPGSRELQSRGMITTGLEFQAKTTRFNIVEANFYAAHKVAEAGFDVIDLHYYFLLQTFRRNRDGIHWTPEANRHVTNMILTHVSLAEDLPLPGRNSGDYGLERVIFMSDIAKGKISDSRVKEKLQDLNRIATNMVTNSSYHKDHLPQLDQLADMARSVPNVSHPPDAYYAPPPEQQQQQHRPLQPPQPQPYRNQQQQRRYAPYDRPGGNAPRHPMMMGGNNSNSLPLPVGPAGGPISRPNVWDQNNRMMNRGGPQVWDQGQGGHHSMNNRNQYHGPPQGPYFNQGPPDNRGFGGGPWDRPHPMGGGGQNMNQPMMNHMMMMQQNQQMIPPGMMMNNMGFGFGPGGGQNNPQFDQNPNLANLDFIEQLRRIQDQNQFM